MDLFSTAEQDEDAQALLLSRDAGFLDQVEASIERLLLEHYLIRSDKRHGVNWYELTHDRLVRPIMRDNRLCFLTVIS